MAYALRMLTRTRVLYLVTQLTIYVCPESKSHKLGFKVGIHKYILSLYVRL